VLFAIDPEPYRIALGRPMRRLPARVSMSNSCATYSQATAQEKSDLSEVDYAQSQYDRAAGLLEGINTKSSLDEAKNDLDKARQQLAVAQQRISAPRPRLAVIPTSRPTSIRP
jgi:membrane fusion protein (multidrug efflux system)